MGTVVETPYEKLLREHHKVLAEYLIEPDPEGFFDQAFTLTQLQDRMELISGSKFQRDTFRRKMLKHLEAVGTEPPPYIGRPAVLYVKKVIQ